MSPRTPIRPSRLGLCLRALCISALLQAGAHAHGTIHELLAASDREIAAHPDDAALYLRRAFLHLDHGDWQACLRDVAEAERRQRTDLGAGLIRGRALAMGGQREEAKKVLDGFVAAHPDHAGGWMERARVHAALGRHAEAADDFVAGMSHVAQPDPDQVFELAALVSKAGRREEALAALDTALLRAPGLPSLLERAVQIEMELGRHDAALRRMEEAIRAVKIKEPLMARRAAVLAQAGRTQDSIAAWRELHARIAKLPPAERGSHAMSTLDAQSSHAIASLQSIEP